MADYRLKDPAWVERLHDTVRSVAYLLREFDAKVGTYDASPDWHARHREASKALAVTLKEAHGASIGDRFDGARVTLAGLSSSSTSGIKGAVQNWLNAARARLEKADA